MITVDTNVQVTSKDSTLSPFPGAPLSAGAGVKCASGVVGGPITLAAASSGVALPFPVGVTTAAIVVIMAENIGDLVVTYKGQTQPIPAGQVCLLYGAAAADISLASVIGGKVSFLVGG